MKCCVYGAGAIGGHLAAKLGAAGHDVTVIARGAQLEAIRQRGLVLLQGERRIEADVAAFEEPAQAGVQELVFVTTKATALPQIAQRIAPLVGSRTLVAFLQNGMTWWYPIGLPADRPVPPRLPVFELGAAFLQCMRPQQVIGAVVYSANEVLEPGVVRNNSPARNMVELGALDDRDDERLRDARAALEAAGLRSPAPAHIRASVWQKLVINAASGSISVATGNPDSIMTDPAIQQAFLRIARDGLRIAAAHGYPVDDRVDLERWANHRVQHRPSLLQDFEAGRAMEVGEMVLAPVAFARAAGIETPTLDALAAVTARLAADKGLFTPG